MKRPTWMLLGLLALAGCSSGPLLTLSLGGTAAGWPAGQGGTVAAVATPFAGDEVTLAEAAIAGDGAFALSLPRPAEALLQPAGEVYPALPECSSSEVSAPTAGLLFVADFLARDGAGGELGSLAASELGPSGRAVGYLYADAAVTVTQLCVFDGSTFDIALELQQGWNALFVEATSQAGELFRLSSGRPPATVRWAFQPATTATLRTPPALPPGYAWLEPLVARTRAPATSALLPTAPILSTPAPAAEKGSP